MSSSHSVDRSGIALVILAMGTFLLGLTEFSMMPMLPLIADSFQVSTDMAGHAISAYALGVVVGAPLFMVMTPKMDRRNALLLFSIVIFLFNGLSAASASFGQLVLCRFLSGLPHGAYFGTALLFGAKLAPEGRATRYMSRVFMGLTIATIIGVPVATAMAQNFSWRWSLLLVASLAFIESLLIFAVLPKMATESDSLSADLAVLKNPLVWPIVGIGVIGFGGIFCLYTYLADTMLEVTRAPAYMIPVAMVVFGVGSTVGNWIVGFARDQIIAKVTGIFLIYAIVIAFMFVHVATTLWLLLVVVFLLGACLGLTTVIQSQLMSVVKDGQAVLGALLQCAFNTANAIGPALGGLIFSHQLPANDTGYVSVFLFAGGFIMWVLSQAQWRRYQERVAARHITS